ncbi:hypothetical protein GCM10008967_20330 [Bacillus carboniphilus]|uniref:Uncharacterized protein n=1 Tax=Bacillus carboniphilus TaxID=86663 RepID=A0ABN0W9X1_9BACI
MDYIAFGNLTIPSTWISTVIALIVTAAISRFILRRKTEDWYWNGFLVFFLVWKLSYIVFHFEIFIRTPLSVVYFNGGLKGHILALLSLSIYFVFLAKKNFPSISKDAIHLFILFFISYELLHSVILDQFGEASLHGFILISFIVVYTSLNKRMKLSPAQIILIFSLLEFLAISLFRIIFTIEGLTFVWVGITVLILTYFDRRN